VCSSDLATNAIISFACNSRRNYNTSGFRQEFLNLKVRQRPCHRNL
jgi:hypothetical protein